MHRRRALQIGAALATLPFVGCGPSTPEPRPAPTGPAGPASSHAAVPDAAPADAGAAVTPPGDATADQSADPVVDAAAKEPAKEPFSRVVARVGRNHGHVLTVAFADVKAGVEKSYDLAGSAGHPHTVTLSPDDMKNLLAGQIFRAKSTRDKQHAHRVLVQCAPAVDPPEWVSVCEATFSGKDEHELVIPAADVAGQSEKTYDVQGIAGHAHQLTITPADFQKLVKGEALSIVTSRLAEDAHLHVVFIQYRRPSKT